MNREQKINKREIKQAVKEILNEEKVTQDQLRLIIREELELQEKLREEKDNPSVVMASNDFLKNKKWKAVGWIALLWIVVLFTSASFSVYSQASNNIINFIIKEEKIVTIMGQVVLFVLSLIILALLIGFDAFIYDRIRKYTKKYAKIATLLIFIYWIKVFVPGFETWLAYLF